MMSRVLHLMELVNMVRLLDKIGQKSFKENDMSNEAFLSYENCLKVSREYIYFVNKFTTNGKLRWQRVLWPDYKE